MTSVADDANLLSPSHSATATTKGNEMNNGTKIVKSAKNIWNNDRVVWGGLGYGYANADFDGIRGGTREVTFTDGTVKAYQITSEDDPSEWLNVGDTVMIYNENPYGQQPVDASSIPF